MFRRRCNTLRAPFPPRVPLKSQREDGTRGVLLSRGSIKIDTVSLERRANDSGKYVSYRAKCH